MERNAEKEKKRPLIKEMEEAEICVEMLLEVVMNRRYTPGSDVFYYCDRSCLSRDEKIELMEELNKELKGSGKSISCNDVVQTAVTLCNEKFTKIFEEYINSIKCGVQECFGKNVSRSIKIGNSIVRVDGYNSFEIREQSCKVWISNKQIKEK